MRLVSASHDGTRRYTATEQLTRPATAPTDTAFCLSVPDVAAFRAWQDRLSTAELLNSRWFTEQGVYGREEAVELMSEYLEGLYGPHTLKYLSDPPA